MFMMMMMLAYWLKLAKGAGC